MSIKHQKTQNNSDQTKQHYDRKVHTHIQKKDAVDYDEFVYTYAHLCIVIIH